MNDPNPPAPIPHPALSVAAPDEAPTGRAGRGAARIGFALTPVQLIVFTVGYHVDLQYVAAWGVGAWLITGMVVNGAAWVAAISAGQRPDADPRAVRWAKWLNGVGFCTILLATLYVIILDPIGPHLR